MSIIHNLLTLNGSRIKPVCSFSFQKFLVINCGLLRNYQMPIHCHKLFQQQNLHLKLQKKIIEIINQTCPPPSNTLQWTRAQVSRDSKTHARVRTRSKAHVTSQTVRYQLCAKLGGEEKTFKTLAFLREQRLHTHTHTHTHAHTHTHTNKLSYGHTCLKTYFKVTAQGTLINLQYQ